MTSTDRIEPGRSALIMGPSGSGKSHLIRTALEKEGSGVVVMAQGTDEMESYRSLYSDAEFLLTPSDVERLIVTDSDGKARLECDAPYLLAAFDDEAFYPSDGSWQATGHKSVVNFLRLVRAAVTRGEGKPQWKVLATDTLSGVGALTYNAMCSALKVEHPPKARGEGGAEFYLGYAAKMEEVARACRSIRGYGVSWLASTHVQKREADEAYGAKDVTGKEQIMAAFVGRIFRERLPAYFDLVLYTGIGNDNKHYAQWEPDAFRATKSRYRMDPAALDKKQRIENDWSVISEAICQ